MDKRDFFHKLKGLRVSKAVEQTLFLSRTKTGKKFEIDFRGSSAHSILWIFSSLSTKGPETGSLGAVGSWPGRRRAGVVVTDASGVGRFFFVEQNDVGIDDEKVFFDRAAGFKAARQVYNQKLVYRIMVIVNGATLLWISRVFSTTSNVYGSHKPVGWSCMFLVAKLDKNPGYAKNRSSSHFVPVDIHTLIHSPATPC